MIVAGANRHAKEILELLHQSNFTDSLTFFDDYNKNGPRLFYNIYPIIKDVKDLNDKFKTDPRFILGLGNPFNRFKVALKLKAAGGILTSIISYSAKIGHYDVNLSQGINVMEYVLINNSVQIGEGCLINAFASIHHDVSIGQYCEISPRVTLLGGAKVGNFCAIGTGAIVLPDITVGDNVVIGAGAVITKDVQDNSLVVGVPGKFIRLI